MAREWEQAPSPPADDYTTPFEVKRYLHNAFEPNDLFRHLALRTIYPFALRDVMNQRACYSVRIDGRLHYYSCALWPDYDYARPDESIFDRDFDLWWEGVLDGEGRLWNCQCLNGQIEQQQQAPLEGGRQKLMRKRPTPNCGGTGAIYQCPCCFKCGHVGCLDARVRYALRRCEPDTGLVWRCRRSRLCAVSRHQRMTSGHRSDDAFSLDST